MVANKIPNRRKCGNILINIKSVKNKNKSFTFHCTFCSTDYDQLKKFSKHIEERHLDSFEEELLIGSEVEPKSPILIFEPEEIKVEVNLDVEPLAEVGKKIGNGSEDPLRAEKSQENKFIKLYNSSECDERNIKNEHNENDNKQIKSCDIAHSDNKTQNTSKDPLESENSQQHEHNKMWECGTIKVKNEYEADRCKTANNVQEADELTSENIIKPITISPKDFNSDEFSDDSNANDFAIDTDINKASSASKLKRTRRTIIDKIIPILIQQYKKHESLWQINNIEFGIKNKKYEIYAKIAEYLKIEPKCNISLDDINYYIKYINELYSKDKEQELKCKLEKMEFLPEYEHYAEMSFLSESQGPFLCTICNKILPKYDPYCQHLAQHNGTHPFKCPVCDMMYTNYQKYLIHKKRHLGIFAFHCNICGKGYLSKNDLEWHVTSHTGDKPYLCQICGTGFRARHGYDNHVRRHEERFRHECHICKKGFNHLHALNSHVKSHLNIRDVICKICGKGFVHSKYLKRHELIHGKEKNYKCKECGKAFYQSCGLRSHRKNHHF